MISQYPERRARTVALLGLVFQILLTTFYLVLAIWSRSQAMMALTAMTAVGNAIWLLLLLIYHQRVLVEAESFETEELQRQRDATTGGAAIFDVGQEGLLLARRRLQWMYRWLVPFFSLVVIVGLACAAMLPWNWSLRTPLSAVEWPAPQHSSVLIWFMGGAAFLCFLLARYVAGMSRQREWRMLRVGASYVMGVTLATVAMGATLAVLHFMETSKAEHVLAYVLRCLMLVLAAEFTMNLVLDFYRPRLPDEEPRPAFDSRLLGLFTEPGGIARSIADAINYQFGFEVSSTWFYKLVERAAVPLIGFAVASLLLASSLVFISADERGVVEHFGQPIYAAGKPAILQPGLHFKWPWPIDRVYRVRIDGIHEMQIGTEVTNKPASAKADELILWTNKHEQEPHLQVLVASPRLAEFMVKPAGDGKLIDTGISTQPSDLSQTTQAVSVSMLRVAMAIQYRVRDAFEWLTTYREPEGLLKAVAEREITRGFASASVLEVLGPQRGVLEQTLRERIQQRADETGLGVDIVFLGLQGVHPPEQTAEKFQEVIGAEWKAATAERTAQSDYNKKLSDVVGNVEQAVSLSQAIGAMNRLEADASASEEDREAARRKVQTLFFGDRDQGVAAASGEANSIIAQARAERWRIENEAQRRAIAFGQEMAIKDVAPAVYKLRMYLTTLADAVKSIRKYAIATQAEHGQRTFHLDIKDPMNAPMDVALEQENP